MQSWKIEIKQIKFLFLDIVHRLNERILNTEKSRFLDLTKGLAKVGESMRYVTSKHHTDEVKPLTYWLLADLSQSDHRELLSSALEQMVSENQLYSYFDRIGIGSFSLYIYHLGSYIHFL